MKLPEPLSPEEEKAALIKHDSTAKDLLREHNLRLVLHIARKFENTEVDIEELFSIGTLGLIKGIDTFDINKNIKLATYISRCIENEILLYLRRTKKWSKDVSIDVPIKTSQDGDSITAQDILSDPKDENELYRTEEIEYVSNILSIALNLLSTQKLLIALYTMSEITQLEIAKHMSISQSYVSRLQNRYYTETRKIREYSDEVLKAKYPISQSNELNFIFFLDNRGRFCLSIHSKFLNPFIAFMETHDNEFETADGRIIIRLPNDESSYLFCAQLIQYLSKHIT